MTEQDGPTTRFDAATSYVHLEERGAPLARMELIVNAPHEVVLVHPRIEPGADVLAAAAALVAAGRRHASELGVRETWMYFDSRGPNCDAFAAAAPSWGFELDTVKDLFRAPKEALRLDAVPAPAPDVAFTEFDDETPELFGRILATSAAPSDRAADPREMIAGFQDRCRVNGSFHPADWIVIRLGASAAGVAFPAFVDPDLQAATHYYVGVAPEFRGRDLAPQMLRRGIETMLARGATRIIGSCVVSNDPMRRTFERVGMSRIATRHVFRTDA